MKSRLWSIHRAALAILTALLAAVSQRSGKIVIRVCRQPYGGEERCVLRFGGETRGTNDHLEDPGADGKVILKLIFKQWDGESWTGFIRLGIWTGGGRL